MGDWVFRNESKKRPREERIGYETHGVRGELSTGTGVRHRKGFVQRPVQKTTRTIGEQLPVKESKKIKPNARGARSTK